MLAALTAVVSAHLRPSVAPLVPRWASVPPPARIGTPAPASNCLGMAIQRPGEPAPPAPDRIQVLAQRAARVQDLLQDMEVALLASADKHGLQVLVGLKRAWREFRGDEGAGLNKR